MNGRALLNVVETHMLDGLEGDARAEIRRSIHDPEGFLADRNEQTKALLLEAGGEIG